jgi:hypothetical protein
VRKSGRRKIKESLGTGYSREATFVGGGTPDNEGTRGFNQGAISVFILFHLIASVFWTAPSNSVLVVGVRELVNPYMQWTALAQSWDTFAPNPKSVNVYIKAVILTPNRHIHVWAFPRMDELNFRERYRKERYRKFAESLVEPNNAVVLPDVAMHVARIYKNHVDPPDEVLLVEYLADIKPGSDTSYAETSKPIVLYDDDVETEDLR